MKNHHLGVALAPALAAILLTASACGSTSSSQSTAPGAASGAGGAGQQQSTAFPGANGEVVDVSGTTMQVQSEQGGQATGQTAVSWTAKTSFTRQVSGALADVKVGSCVLVTSAATPSTSAASGTAVDAGSVRLISGPGTSCGVGGARGRPGGVGGRPSGAPSARPSGAPAGGPGDARGQRFGGGAIGTVTTLASGGFTLSSTMRGSDAAKTTVAVTTTDKTTVTRTVSATAAALKVGTCISARGTSNDTGTVAATTVAISAKQDGTCTSGFGSGRPDGARPGAAGTPS